ncbi:MAG TPA: class I SAM-dependent methyltransferase [Thermoleophilaceae bacterium]
MSAPLDPRDVYREALESFRGDVRSIPDVFGLLRPDTPEMPRYLLTLRAAAEHARGRGGRRLRVCDLGGYYGIVTAAIGRLGYAGEVVDDYGPLLADTGHADLRGWWERSGLTVHDLDLQSPDLRLPFEDGSFDLVTFLAVIEHFPHTPRLALDEARRILRPDGLLILDTPNAGSLGTRVGFALHGEGVWSDVGELYRSDVPFPGHKRCYSRRELLAVLDWAGFEPAEVRMLDLEETRGSDALRARVLYDVVQPALRRRWPDLRGYVWISARPRSG